MTPEERIALSLQYEASACADELLDISEDIGKYVIPAYKENDAGVFELQCRIQGRRLDMLFEKLTRIQKELEGTDRAKMSDFRSQSAGITIQTVIQNLAIIAQKQGFLKELLMSSKEAAQNMAAAKKLEDTAQIMELCRILKKELKACESEK